MLQTLIPGWDSIFVGNRMNLDVWKEGFHKSFHQARKSALVSKAWIELVTDISMILSLSPVLGTLAYLMHANVDNPSKLAVMVATLPRQIMTIQHLSDVILYAAE